MAWEARELIETHPMTYLFYYCSFLEKQGSICLDYTALYFYSIY